MHGFTELKGFYCKTFCLLLLHFNFNFDPESSYKKQIFRMDYLQSMVITKNFSKLGKLPANIQNRLIKTTFEKYPSREALPLIVKGVTCYKRCVQHG